VLPPLPGVPPPPLPWLLLLLPPPCLVVRCCRRRRTLPQLLDAGVDVKDAIGQPPDVHIHERGAGGDAPHTDTIGARNKPARCNMI
jgi:hypothetical protein